jgi:DNA-binding NarL/FixJ family response regulator
MESPAGNPSNPRPAHLRVAIVDDHQMFREAVRALLSTQPEFELVAEGASANDARAIVDQMRPDVVLMDATFPSTSGFEATSLLRGARSNVKVLFVSALRDANAVARALASGAAGFVCKDQPAAALLEAVRAVSRGRQYLPPQISRFAVDEELARLQRHRLGVGGEASLGPDGPVRETRPTVAPGAEPPADPVAPLTPKEREVFKLLVGGADNRTIAGRLRISVKTVETHRARILKKLGVHNLAELIRFAARAGLL